MNKYLYSLIIKKLIGILLLVGFNSCKKNTPIRNIDSDLYTVNFKIEEFQQSIKPIASTNSNYHADYSTKEIVKLLFRVYDSNDNLVKHEFQENSQNNFGKYSVSLPKGNFKLAVVAYSNFVNVTATYNDIRLHGLAIPIKQSFPYSVMSYEHFDLMVSNFVQFEVGSGNVNEKIELERLYGRLCLNIIDKIPENADKLFFKINNAVTDIRYPALHLTPTQTHELGEVHDLNEYKNKSGQFFSMKVLTPRQEVVSTLTVFVYDVNDNILLTKTIPNVKVKRNSITLVEGKLFDEISLSEPAFSVEKKDKFNTDTIRVSF